MNKKAKKMQRAKDANNKWVFIFVLWVSFCFSQKTLEGAYYVDNNPEWVAEAGVFTNYEFKEDNSFTKEVSGEFGIYFYGHGEYKFIDDKLILNYYKTRPLKIGHHVSEIWTNSKDSIHLSFYIFDFDSLPLPAVNVIYKDSLSPYGLSGVAANEKGIALIKLKRDRTDLQVEISNLGFKTYKFSLDKNYNSNISVFLQKAGEGIPIRNQTDTLQIEKIKPKYFTVKNKNGSITKWQKIEE